MPDFADDFENTPDLIDIYNSIEKGMKKPLYEEGSKKEKLREVTKHSFDIIKQEYSKE